MLTIIFFVILYYASIPLATRKTTINPMCKTYFARMEGGPSLEKHPTPAGSSLQSAFPNRRMKLNDWNIIGNKNYCLTNLPCNNMRVMVQDCSMAGSVERPPMTAL